MTIRALAHAIVRRYPAAWRERYEAEVRALIDDTSPRLRDLGELLHGMLTERTREFLMSDENPRRAARVIGIVAPIVGGLFVATAWLTGFGVRSATGPWSDPALYSSLFIFCVLGVVASVLRYRGKKRRDWQQPLLVPPDVAIVLLPIVFIEVLLYTVVVFSSEPYETGLIPNWLIRAYFFVMFAGFAGNVFSSLLPGHELMDAFARLSAAETQIKANEAWAVSCREWIARGVPSPYDDALIQIGKWTIERDRARERLRELGYRARFRVGPPAEHEPHT